MSSKRICGNYPRCPRTSDPGDRYCPPCRQKYNREREQEPERKAKKAYYGTKAHDLFRQEVLSNDPFCVCVADYCIHPKPCNQPSRIADHVVPRERGGSDDPSNGQGLCKECHDLKTNLVDKGRTGGLLEAILVCGPPGSGKTKYVMERFQPGDVLVDFEQLMIALTGLRGHSYPDALKPLGWDAMDAVLERLPRLDGSHRVWITACAPRRAQRERLQRGFQARVVILEVKTDECLSRLERDTGRDSRVNWERLVKSWWTDYERKHGDERRDT